MRDAPSVNVPVLKTIVYDTADITTNKHSSINICLFVFTTFCENETQTLNKIWGRLYLMFAKTTRDNAHKNILACKDYICFIIDQIKYGP